jgi:hypothetical protein
MVYRSTRTPQNRAMEAMQLRMRRTLDIVLEARRDLPRDMRGANERLKRVQNYYEKTIAATDAVLQELGRERTSRRTRRR